MIHLKLDQAALVSLFPEGSEARLVLQNACIAQFTKNIFARHMPAEAIARMSVEVEKFSSTLSTALSAARQDIVNKAAVEHGLISVTPATGFGGKPGVTLSAETIAQIKAQVVGRMNEDIRSSVIEAIEERAKTYMEKPGMFDEYIERVVANQLKSGVVAKVTAALG